MELRLLKTGNLMGSPDVKDMLQDGGPGSPRAQALWQDVFTIKLALGYTGQATTALLLEPDIPAFPAVMDFSFITADPASHGDESLKAARRSLAAHGLELTDIRSVLTTHLHPDHFDGRLTAGLDQAQLFVPPEGEVPGSTPFSPAHFGGLLDMVSTPGHGGPHCSYLVDLPDLDASVCMAGDLVMSQAHFLSPDHPLSFADGEAGRASITVIRHALYARKSRFKLILPGHDLPFFVGAP